MIDRIEHLFRPSDLKEYEDFMIVIYPPKVKPEEGIHFRSPVYCTLGDLVKRIVREVKTNEQK